jgi:transcriptional regulator with XRE-family HTH domain
VKESVSKRFQKRLKALRKERNWTQEKAAAVCDVGYKLFQLYELGIKKNPGLLTLEKIAHGFNLDVSELLAPSVPRIRPANSPAKKLKANVLHE